MRKFIFLFICLISNSLFSQDNNYIQYHQEIVNARLAIADENFEKSLFYYQNAFSLVNVAFKIDLMNAAKCGALSHNDSLMYLYIESSLKKGLSFLNYKNDTITFKDYINTPKWMEIENKSSFYKKEFESKINKRYIELLDSLDKKDQYYRRKKTFMGIGKTNKFKYMRYQDSLIAIALDSLRNLWGYPSDKNIGKASFSLICFHHRCADSIYLKEVELKALQEGDITPGYYIYAYNRYLKSITGQDKYLESDNTMGLAQEQIDTINKNRFIIGYASISEMIKIKSYFYNKNKNRFNFIDPLF